jgi:nitroimidazol reductase NimA-like FMN-containing flavoprotein (pyridoxamine 5'-phosphate oxidase superfamily)
MSAAAMDIRVHHPALADSVLVRISAPNLYPGQIDREERVGMTTTEPVTDVDDRYGDPGAQPTDWALARATLAAAELSWISTVRPDGRPHVTPLLTVCEESTVFFCTGPEERKCRNLTENPHVTITTGCNSAHGGLDLVVEGDAVRVVEESALRRLADAWVAKYGEDWRFGVGNGAFLHPAGGEAWVFAVKATTVFGFGKDPYSQTRWRFTRD